MHLGLAMMQTLKPPPPILLHHQPQHSTSLASSLLNSNLAGMENHQMQQQHLPIPLQPHLPNQLGHHLQFSHHAAQQLQHSHQHQSLLLPPTNSHNPQLGLLVNSPSAVSVAAHPSNIIAAGNAAIPSCTVPLQQLTPQSTIPVAIPTVSLPSSQTLNNNSSNNSNNNNNDNSNNNNNTNSTSNNQPSCSVSNGVLIDCPGGGNNDHDEPNPEMVLALISRNRELEATIPKCGGCHELILDRFILKVLERTWHAKCLQCSECHAQLNDKCFARNGQLFCKDDFFKRYGTKCSACDMGIPPTQVVRRAQDNVYHLQCFLCAICSRTLNTGDEFYLMEDRKLVCKRDYEEAKAKGLYLDGSLDGDQPNKRPRTTITAKQLETLKTAYNNSPKPARHVREQLSQDTGLDMRVVQVWFQNRRAKEKRLKKDAGRTRWSQYFRTMKGNCSPRTEKFLDKDDLKVDYDSFSHHDLSNDSYSTVNLGLDEGASPHSLRGSYMHGSSSPSQYPSSRSPPPAGQNHSFGSYPDNIVYTNVEHNSSTNLHGSKSSSQRLHSGSAVSDMSNDSSPDQGYPDFPPSPDSWLGDAGNNTSNPNPSTPGGVHY